MLKGSTIACTVNKVELVVELSALSSLPRKVSFLIRMRQAIDGRFRHNRTTFPGAFFEFSNWNCSSSEIVEVSYSHVHITTIQQHRDYTCLKDVCS